MNKYIIFVSANINKDGAERSLIELQKYLNCEKGICTITVIPSQGLIEELLNSNRIEYIIYMFQGNVNAGRGKKLLRGITKMLINIIQAKKLAKMIKKKNIDVVGVHSNTITSEFGCYLAEELKVPHIWHIREFGKLDFNFDFELGMNYMKKCTSKAARIICNSKTVMNYYQRYFNNNLLTYVYNGIEIVPESEHNWEDKIFKMILVGRLSKEKGQLCAIEACKKLKDAGINNFILDFYGNGVDEGIIKDRIMKYHLERQVRLCGYSNDIPFEMYHAGLMCSHYEAFGRVTVEYMFNSIPVIGVNTGGTPEIIDNGITGLLYDYDDVNGLFEAIRRLYIDRNCCKVMGQAGRKRALGNFTQKQYLDNVYKIYEEVLLC